MNSAEDTRIAGSQLRLRLAVQRRRRSTHPPPTTNTTPAHAPAPTHSSFSICCCCCCCCYYYYYYYYYCSYYYAYTTTTTAMILPLDVRTAAALGLSLFRGIRVCRPCLNRASRFRETHRNRQDTRSWGRFGIEA